jgi:hypothetical protein
VSGESPFGADELIAAAVEERGGWTMHWAEVIFELLGGVAEVAGWALLETQAGSAACVDRDGSESRHAPEIDGRELPPLDGLAIARAVSRWSSSPVESRPTDEPQRLDTREIAQVISGWSSATQGSQLSMPGPSRSPHSDPLWDRELDG